jgi:hypothetical protein
VAIVALAGCESAPDDATPSAADLTVPPSTLGSARPSADASVAPTDGGSGQVTSVFDLELGDCFNADSDRVASVVVVDCSRPHGYEVFHVFDHEAGPDAPYPGDQGLLDEADMMCQPPFEEFVGIDYAASIWFITSVTPSAETWAEGDREVVCTLDQQDQDGVAIEVTGSAEGSGR